MIEKRYKFKGKVYTEPTVSNLDRIKVLIGNMMNDDKVENASAFVKDAFGDFMKHLNVSVNELLDDEDSIDDNSIRCSSSEICTDCYAAGCRWRVAPYEGYEVPSFLNNAISIQELEELDLL